MSPTVLTARQEARSGGSGPTADRGARKTSLRSERLGVLRMTMIVVAFPTPEEPHRGVCKLWATKEPLGGGRDQRHFPTLVAPGRRLGARSYDARPRGLPRDPCIDCGEDPPTTTAATSSSPTSSTSTKAATRSRRGKASSRSKADTSSWNGIAGGRSSPTPSRRPCGNSRRWS
jgi:hypothetical protein